MVGGEEAVGVGVGGSGRWHEEGAVRGKGVIRVDEETACGRRM